MQLPGSFGCPTLHIVTSIAVALIEDQRATREGLAELINSSPGLAMMGQFPCMEEALPAIRCNAPDVLLVDIGLPGISGIEGVRIIHKELPLLPILMLTVIEDDDAVFAAICAGACGYLLKETAPQRILECIQELHAGGAPMSPTIARKVVTTLRGSASTDVNQALSGRQMEILGLLAEGHSYKSCAAHLDLSIDTVRFHVRRIYDRLHVNSRSEAVWKAFGLGRLRGGA